MWEKVIHPPRENAEKKDRIPQTVSRPGNRQKPKVSRVARPGTKRTQFERDLDLKIGISRMSGKFYGHDISMFYTSCAKQGEPFHWPDPLFADSEIEIVKGWAQAFARKRK